MAPYTCAGMKIRFWSMNMSNACVMRKAVMITPGSVSTEQVSNRQKTLENDYRTPMALRLLE